MDFLEKILEHKKKLIKGKELFYSSLEEKFEKNDYSQYEIFKKRIIAPGERISGAGSPIRKGSPKKTSKG